MSNVFDPRTAQALSKLLTIVDEEKDKAGVGELDIKLDPSPWGFFVDFPKETPEEFKRRLVKAIQVRAEKELI